MQSSCWIWGTGTSCTHSSAVTCVVSKVSWPSGCDMTLLTDCRYGGQPFSQFKQQKTTQRKKPLSLLPLASDPSCSRPWPNGCDCTETQKEVAKSSLAGHSLFFFRAVKILDLLPCDHSRYLMLVRSFELSVSLIRPQKEPFAIDNLRLLAVGSKICYSDRKISVLPCRIDPASFGTHEDIHGTAIALLWSRSCTWKWNWTRAHTWRHRTHFQI